MKLFDRIARIFSFSPYEAANYSSRRARVPGAAPSHAKQELTASTQRELVRKSRYLTKNSGFACEVVGDMGERVKGHSNIFTLPGNSQARLDKN